MIIAGVDIGGTTIKVGISIDQELKCIEKIPADASGSLQNKLPEIAGCVEKLVASHTSQLQPDAIGIAFPSIVDSDKKRITSQYVKFSESTSMNLAKWARDTWGIPLALENDARAALVGEWQYGAGKGHDNIVMCTLGTGFGSAAVCNGKLLKGAHYIAGNLGGHMTIDFNGDVCNCGNIGCVETHGSSWMLDHRFGQRPELKSSAFKTRSALNYQNIFQYANTGDAFAIEIRDHAIKAWSIAVANLVHAFDPSVVIIGGGVMRSKEVILPRIQAYVDKYTWPAPGTYKILPAKYSEEAGVMGAAYLGLRELQESHSD